MEHDDFNMLFVSFISRQFTEDISSQGRMPQMKTLVELFCCFKQLAILRRPFAIFSGESWYILLVPHYITASLKDEKECKSCTSHSTCCTLSPSISQFRALHGSKNLSHTSSHQSVLCQNIYYLIWRNV